MKFGDRMSLPAFGMYHEASSTLMSAIPSLQDNQATCDSIGILASDSLSEFTEKLLGSRNVSALGERSVLHIRLMRTITYHVASLLSPNLSHLT